MKSISIRVSVDGKPAGAVTLSARESVYLLASAKVNRCRNLAKYVHRTILFLIDDDDDSGCLLAPDLGDILAVAVSGQERS
jgi:hypothetical protein